MQEQLNSMLISSQESPAEQVGKERQSILPPKSKKVVFRKLVYPHERVELENLYKQLKVERKFYMSAKPKPIR